MGTRLAKGAVGAVTGAAGAARHVAWYLSYCLDGSATRPAPSTAESGERPLSRAS